MVSQPASFRAYESPEQSFQGYADFLLSNPRYRDVLSASGIENQIAEMAKSGYATDPNYGAKLANIASKFDPNAAPIIASDTMQALGMTPQQAAQRPMQQAVPQMPAPMPQQPKDPFEGMGIFSKMLAQRGIYQNADAAPIANLWYALEGRREAPQGGLLGLLNG